MSLPDFCPYCGHDGFMRLDCRGKLAKPPTPGVWWCEACGAAIEPSNPPKELPAMNHHRPGTVVSVHPDRVPQQAQATQEAMPEGLGAVLRPSVGFDLEDFAYTYFGDRDGPSEAAEAAWNALGGPTADWHDVFVGGDPFDVPVVALPACVLEEAHL